MAYMTDGRIVKNFSRNDKYRQRRSKAVLTPEVIGCTNDAELRNWYGKPMNVSSCIELKVLIVD